VERGGSDRQFWRGGGAASGLVAVAYGLEKAENARYADCALFLEAQGVSVPRVIAHDAAQRFLLLEDAGAEDLWSHREAPWEKRAQLYRETLEQAALLHGADLAAAGRAAVLQAPFDADLYRWEQDYFFEHFLGALRRDLAPFEKQAAALAARPRVLLHRDFQSQNILVRDGRVTFIDFQGMRFGPAAYDLASLLLDPYIRIDTDLRALADMPVLVCLHHPPVPVGSEVRARMKLLSIEDLPENGAQMIWEGVFERKGADRPVCVAESISRRYA
jgi:aminoglycoside/choline kinase family phosphotransferase